MGQSSECVSQDLRMFIILTPATVSQIMAILHGWAVEEGHVWSLPAHMSSLPHFLPVIHTCDSCYSCIYIFTVTGGFICFPSSPISCFLLSFSWSVN